jgi:hypothetical protein
MRTYEVTLIGRTPLLMHNDNIEWADDMAKWRSDPKNKTTSKKGDDRSPAHTWLGCCYHDGTNLCIPAANVMRAAMEGGAMVPVPGGKGGKTFKAQSQSGMQSIAGAWDFYINGEKIPWAPLDALKSESDFSKHKRATRDLGFDLLVGRAKIGAAKHVRVRPKFDTGWRAIGKLLVWDEQITETVLAQIFEYAGQYKGLGDWRPGSKTPGSYGQFDADVELV